jgi:hypothetical protein
LTGVQDQQRRTNILVMQLSCKHTHLHTLLSHLVTAANAGCPAGVGSALPDCRNIAGADPAVLRRWQARQAWTGELRQKMKEYFGNKSFRWGRWLKMVAVLWLLNVQAREGVSTCAVSMCRSAAHMLDVTCLI